MVGVTVLRLLSACYCTPLQPHLIKAGRSKDHVTGERHHVLIITKARVTRMVTFKEDTGKCVALRKT